VTPSTNESQSPRSGYKRLRIAFIACFTAFCLAVCYVLLSAPLMLYAACHPGNSTAEMVEAYLQPLLWTDELLTPDFEATDGEYKEPLHAKMLDCYYGLWGSGVEDYYFVLRLKRYLESFMESMEQDTPFLGADGPNSDL
jgi:hypothetical protein